MSYSKTGSTQAVARLQKELKGTYSSFFAIPLQTNDEILLQSILKFDLVYFHPLTSFLDLIKNPVEGFKVELADESNLFEWTVYIAGPP